MSDYDQYWLTIWKLVAAVVVVLILTAGGCTAHQQSRITELAMSGVDPIKAACAIRGVAQGTEAICAVVAIGARQ